MSKTARAHTNIALIKYWGKKDAKLRLPLMSSLSMTLDAFYSDTKISDSEQMSFKLNGQAVSGPAADRVFTYLRARPLPVQPLPPWQRLLPTTTS